jgi:hypothetical protein
MSVDKPEPGVHYTLFIKMADSYYMGKIGGEWQRIGHNELTYPSYQEAVKIPSMNLVRGALRSTEGRRCMEQKGAKIIVAKVTTEIVENTVDSPLEQLAEASE